MERSLVYYLDQYKRNPNWVLNYLITFRQGKLFLNEPTIQRTSKDYLALNSATEASQKQVINTLHFTFESLKNQSESLTHHEIAKTFEENLKNNKS
ncbi:hypothetical protein CIB95_11880 [Lottiidibacillus patelloidae]|uniref:Uncharacterized protein n=1 Tax=Lottiidibacillus patelloidae TaxID=2670334 RepID=A0A263BSC4_9BACI|nr:hypothetical protein [Lottiidibacillus patelloidae]OZM56468.1 hypothetical protein CIB95_11880 [Lottiidibacillus patelloidae]